MFEGANVHPAVPNPVAHEQINPSFSESYIQRSPKTYYAFIISFVKTRILGSNIYEYIAQQPYTVQENYRC